ncbi:MAG: cytochrome b, partial [Rhodobacteraceae bacterium]|nr:cytochrome b [Paracoccaceae bacterium]
VPEWYFLPFYAILRAVPDKLGGVLAMFGAIAILFVLPWLDTSRVRSGTYRPLFKQFFVIFALNAVALGYLGSLPAEGVYVILSRVCTVYYFAHFLVILPLLGFLEKPSPLPASISEAVLKGGAPTSAGAASAPDTK